MLRGPWAFLNTEPELPEDLKEAGTRLKNLIEKESFHREVAEIERLGMKLQDAFRKLQEDALEARAKACDGPASASGHDRVGRPG